MKEQKEAERQHEEAREKAKSNLFKQYVLVRLKQIHDKYIEYFGKDEYSLEGTTLNPESTMLENVGDGSLFTPIHLSMTILDVVESNKGDKSFEARCSLSDYSGNEVGTNDNSFYTAIPCLSYEVQGYKIVRTKEEDNE